jgi:hypothetical protein
MVTKPIIAGVLYQLSLFPQNDIITKEIESWTGFADSLHAEDDRNLFKKMLNECYKYSVVINDKGEPFPAEPFNHGFIIITTKNDRLANIPNF